MLVEEAVSLVKNRYPDKKLISYRDLGDKFVFEYQAEESDMFMGIPMDVTISVDAKTGKVENFLPQFDERFFDSIPKGME